ncbi:MAG: putative Ig domain-containing protein [Dehalococcoidia bacterium]
MWFSDTSTLQNAFVGEYYKFQIPVYGGRPPYQLAIIIGNLPEGLEMDMDGTIHGVPSAGANTSNFIFTVRARDYAGFIIDKQFNLPLLYRASLYIAFPSQQTQTTITIDDKTKIIGHGYETIVQTFEAGTRPWINLESVVQSESDNTTRYRPKQESFRIDDSQRYITIAYDNEYYMDVTTEPAQVRSELPYDYSTLTRWYKSEEVLQYSVPPVISVSENQQYQFQKWLLPYGDRSYGTTLSWKVTYPAQIKAEYDTYYMLTIITPYGATVDGAGWKKAGQIAHWTVSSPSDQAAPNNILGKIGLLKLKPDPSAGDIKMDQPQEYHVEWHEDYKNLIGGIAIVVIGGLLVALIRFLITRHFRKKADN